MFKLVINRVLWLNMNCFLSNRSWKHQAGADEICCLDQHRAPQLSKPIGDLSSELKFKQVNIYESVTDYERLCLHNKIPLRWQKRTQFYVRVFHKLTTNVQRVVTDEPLSRVTTETRDKFCRACHCMPSFVTHRTCQGHGRLPTLTRTKGFLHSDRKRRE